MSKNILVIIKSHNSIVVPVTEWCASKWDGVHPIWLGFVLQALESFRRTLLYLIKVGRMLFSKGK